MKIKLYKGNEHLIVFIGEQETDALIQMGLSQTLLLVQDLDWNAMLSPWPAQRVFGSGKDFAGQADQTIAFLEETLGSMKQDYQDITIMGYSLAGLFALYACTKTDLFDYCISASGSLWYPGWLDYLSNHPLYAKRIYLSLGDQEKNTRIAKMKTVEDCTKKTYELIQNQQKEVTFYLNSGNHFQDPAGRLYKGIQWIFHKEAEQA